MLISSRFEKNLLQIGFFGANDARDKNRTSRRIEQIVVRNGNKIKVAAEFRGSEALGLPSTTDRDKFIALLKIVSEERIKTGFISNPIRFSGYRLIQELGLSRNGEIYEEILRWGKRMTDTTITSEHVVYRAAKKVYSDEVAARLPLLPPHRQQQSQRHGTPGKLRGRARGLAA